MYPTTSLFKIAQNRLLIAAYALLNPSESNGLGEMETLSREFLTSEIDLDPLRTERLHEVMDEYIFEGVRFIYPRHRPGFFGAEVTHSVERRHVFRAGRTILGWTREGLEVAASAFGAEITAVQIADVENGCASDASEAAVRRLLEWLGTEFLGEPSELRGVGFSQALLEQSLIGTELVMAR